MRFVSDSIAWWISSLRSCSSISFRFWWSCFSILLMILFDSVYSSSYSSSESSNTWLAGNVFVWCVFFSVLGGQFQISYLCLCWSSESVAAVLHRNSYFCYGTKRISPIATDNPSTFFSAMHLVRTPAKMTFAPIKHKTTIIAKSNARVCVHCITSSPAHAIIRIVKDVSVDESKISIKFSVVAGFKHKRHILFVFDLWLSFSSVAVTAARFVAIPFHYLHRLLNKRNDSNEQRSLSRCFFKICNFWFDRRIYYLQFLFCTYEMYDDRCDVCISVFLPIHSMNVLNSKLHQNGDWASHLSVFGGSCQKGRPNVKRVLRDNSQRIRVVWILNLAVWKIVMQMLRFTKFDCR